jgi:NAD(P)-dependent dehydrogenase (short-subunit alcohol dehydrogenase family)
MTDLSGRHFLVTGANTGIGKETARGRPNAARE